MEYNGSFTLPGESGQETLTLELAKRWGADVIRDSDGTKLSDEIIQAGYKIYSTICIIRGHNKWAKKHPETLQQCFLVSLPQIAKSNQITINLLDGYFAEQFKVNPSYESQQYWQVFNRTTNCELPKENWQFNTKTNQVVLTGTRPWHKYTINFLVYRIWEEISMYNHVTNSWNTEHLVPLEPHYPQVQKYFLEWLDNWCKENPDTDVVRFTSMFYNFVWIWGAEARNRNLFTDWGSYDFTVSIPALKNFALKYGYSICSEDFINKGNFNVSHIPPSKKQLDWMEYIRTFSAEFGEKLINIVHAYGKEAYMFYDDSWIGTEPYHQTYERYNFDGIIKCVFSGFEVRLCSGVNVPIHELRLHPYLFPTGLGGQPTFMSGGNPQVDAQTYWINVRRALLFAPIERIGLGGYLSITKEFPKFVECIDQIIKEFHIIKQAHESGPPQFLSPKIAILTSWGKLRSWTLSGHFHESESHDLIHILESLSGLPIVVDFISFKDVIELSLDKYDVIINAGKKGDAWSGGDGWSTDVIEKITRFIHDGGAFLGVNEPSATYGKDSTFSLEHLLGVDLDIGNKVNHGRWNFDTNTIPELIPQNATIPCKKDLFVSHKDTRILLSNENLPVMTCKKFGKGNSIYLAGFKYSPANSRLLLNLIQLLRGTSLQSDIVSNNELVDVAYYNNGKKIILINNSNATQKVKILTTISSETLEIKPYALLEYTVI